MKVRLEIIDDDVTESANVEFAGRHWKRRLLAFLDTVEDETDTISEPSSISSNSEVQVAEQNACQPQPVQEPVQQTAPQQQFQPMQQQQAQPVPQQQYQQPVQQAPPQYQQQQMPLMPQQPPQFYVPQPSLQSYPTYSVPQYTQPSPPPVGLQQYGFEQPVRAMVSTVHPSTNAHSQAPPAALHPDQPARRRTPKLNARLNDTSLTINERLELFLRYEYPRVWFSSHDVQQHYERVYGEIKQSTVSTYLSRMFRKDILERRGNRTQREYRYIGDEGESSSSMMEEMADTPIGHRLQY